MPYLADIDELLSEVVSLPSLPTSVMRVGELVNDPDSSLKDLSAALSQDPSMSLKALRLVNSAYYGLRQEVSSVEHCVSLLGPKVIKNVVFTASVFESLQGGEEEHVRHSVACGDAMRQLARLGLPKAFPFEEPEEAFMYGLLHDIGKIVFQEHMPEAYDEVVQACINKPISWHEAEVDVIGVDHAEVGAALARSWKLSPAMCDAILGHHHLGRVESPEHRARAALLSIADGLCYQSGFPCHEAASARIPEACWAEAGTDAEAVAAVAENLGNSTEAIDALTRCTAA